MAITLSIVTAIKDGLDFFRQTAPTILGQTYRDWEWIIVDDGSTERIAEYVESLGDARIRYFRNEASLGQTRCLNQGIRESRSDWVVRMDGDDLAAPERLAEIAKVARSKEDPGFAPLIFSDYDVIREEGELVATVRYNPLIPSAFYQYLFERNNPLAHPTVAFYKYSPKGERYQYDENLRNAQDYALWKRIRLDYPGAAFRHVAKPLIQYRLVHRSLSGAGSREQRFELEAIRSNATAGMGTSQVQVPLGDDARIGMYAFRVLFYRFLGDVPASTGSLRWLAESLRYPAVAPKAAFYAMARPARGLLRKLLFRDIFVG